MRNCSPLGPRVWVLGGIRGVWPAPVVKSSPQSVRNSAAKLMSELTAGNPVRNVGLGLFKGDR